MPVLESRETRSPLATESPPRKKFKFSLKLKPKKKTKAKNPIDSDSDHENATEKNDYKLRLEEEKPSEGLAKSTTSDPIEIDSSCAFGHDSDPSIPPLPYSGLANLGNTCYLNAVMQVLRYCPGFLKSLVNLVQISCQNGTNVLDELTRESASPLGEDLPPSSRPSVIRSIQKLSSEMENAEENYCMFGMEANEVKNRAGWTTLAVRPQDFVRDFSGLCPTFSGYQQHDAQEFLRSFLSLVEEECVGLVKGEQQDSVKGAVTMANSNDTKVRGGCKYPISNPVPMEIKRKYTKTAFAGDTTSQANIETDRSDTAANLYPPTLKSVPKSQPTCSDSVNVVKRLFEGTLRLQTCCLTCEGTRQRYEAFQDISVPVQNTKSNSSEDVEKNLSDSENESDQDLNLSWAISKFASVERLNGDNKYFCDNCATLTEADISTYFEKLPQVLTIHLKRFQTSYGNQSLYSSSWVTKVTKSLHTPQRLSLNKWCSKTCSEKDAVYSLFGVVMHNGMSSCSGHYLSYVNVDILKKATTSKEIVDGWTMDDRCSIQAQREVSRDAKEVDGFCGNLRSESYSGEAARHVVSPHESFKSGSCQSSVNKNDVEMSDCMEDVTKGSEEQSTEVRCEIKGVQSQETEMNRVDENGQYHKGNVIVKCSLCESSSAGADGVGCHCKIIATKNSEARDCGMETPQKDILSACDEQHECKTRNEAEDRNIRSQCVQEESSNLRFEETLSDDEDTCDYTEFMKGSVKQTTFSISDNVKDTPISGVKSDPQINRRISLRNREVDTTRNSYDSDNSSEEDETCHVPRSRKITTFFKPIPKSEDSKKRSRRKIERSFDQCCASKTCPAFADKKLNGEPPKGMDNRTDLCPKTTRASLGVRKSKGCLQQSKNSAFSTLKGTRICVFSNKESLNRKENRTDPDYANDIRNACATHVTTSNDRMCENVIGQDIPYTQRTNSDYENEPTTANSDKAYLKTTEPNANGSQLSDSSTGTTQPVTDNVRNNTDSTTESSNSTASHLTNVQSNTDKTANGSTSVFRGKVVKCEDSHPPSNVSANSSTWLKFDDAEVLEISTKDMNEILSPSTSCYSTPYLLFYYRL